MPSRNEFIHGQTTNYNKLFHSIKAVFFNNSGGSLVARNCANISKFSERYKWIVNFLKRIHMNSLSVGGISGLIGFLKRTETKEKKKIVRMIQILLKQKREN